MKVLIILILCLVCGCDFKPANKIMVEYTHFTIGDSTFHFPITTKYKLDSLTNDYIKTEELIGDTTRCYGSSYYYDQ